MVLGEGENFFSRRKAERRLRYTPLPQPPTPFKKSGVLFLQVLPPAGDYLPFSRKTEYFF